MISIQSRFNSPFILRCLCKNMVLRIVYIGDVILVKTSATVTEYVLALATLGDAPRNRNNPICVALPKVAKARTTASVACRCCQHYHDKLCQCKHSFIQTVYLNLGSNTAAVICGGSIPYSLCLWYLLHSRTAPHLTGQARCFTGMFRMAP